MEFNILYTVNDLYLEKMLVSILSLLEHNLDKSITIHIVTENFKLSDYKRIDDILSKYKSVTVKYYDIKDFNIEKYGISEWRGTQIPNARLFFEYILDLDKIKNLIYLDSDTIVVDDLSHLLSVSDAVSAVSDTTFKTRLTDLGLNKYYNSGVLVFNIDSWIKSDCLKTVIDTIKIHNGDVFKYPDQDLLNIAFNDSIHELPFSYNMPPYCFVEYLNFVRNYFVDSRLVDYDTVMNAKMNPHILHSYGLFGIRPWFKNNVNPFNEIYLNYLKLIDEEPKLEELSNLKKILSISPYVFFTLLLLKNNIPSSFDSKLRTLMVKNGL